MTTIVHEDKKHFKASHLKSTSSTVQQLETEMECQPYFVDVSKLPSSQRDDLEQIGLLKEGTFNLLREKHIDYLSQVWKKGESLKPSFASLDSSRTWIIYWCLHACDLLEYSPNAEEAERIIRTLESCWSSSSSRNGPEIGGFAGGPGQMAHAATNYAAVLALCILSRYYPNARSLMEKVRLPMKAWMLTLKDSDGSYKMAQGNETDVRATYCVLAVAKLLNILDEKLTDGVAEYLKQCQTFEGGFGGEPGAEAHGGYAFCAVASLSILHRFDAIDFDGLMQWLALRQTSFEGGFNGRANKLVDGCYSFWQGSAFIIAGSQPESPVVFDDGMLERYILLCGQSINGGLRDKPSKPRDFYHSCYCLSGLSIAQHCVGNDVCLAYGHKESLVMDTHPVYNIRKEHVLRALQDFGKLDN